MRLPNLTSTSSVLTIAALCGVGVFLYTLAAHPVQGREGYSRNRAYMPGGDPLPNTIPELEQYVLSGRRVGGAWLKLARLYRDEGQEERAKEAWRNAAPLRMEAARRNPDSAELWFDAGWAYSQIGDKENAWEPLGKAEELLTQRARVMSDRLVWYKLGWARKLLGNDTDASIAWTRAKEQLLQEPMGLGEMYDLACYHALLGEVEEAFSALEQATRSGYRDAAHAEHDEDFEGIRKDPRFERAVEFMRQADTDRVIQSGS